MNIRDKVVVITGASRGIGVDLAHAFGERGGRLALAARSADELQEVADALEKRGFEAHAIPTDVGDYSSLQLLEKRVTDELGPADILINNAGIESVEDFETTDPGLIAQIINVNVTGLMWLTRMIVPSMIARRSGHVLNMASMAGLVPVPHNAVYSSSKHAVVGFSSALRQELGEFNVGVSVVCPGFVDGGMFATWGRPAPSAAGSVSVADVTKATIAAVEKNLPLIKVNSMLGKLGPTVVAISPRFSAFLFRRTGVAGFLRDQARINGEAK